MAVTGVSAQYLPQVAVADLLEMISRRMWDGADRGGAQPCQQVGGRPLPCPPSSVRSGGLLLEDGRTSGLLNRAQAEGVRVVGERPASE